MRLIDGDALKAEMDQCIFSDRDRFSTGYAKEFIDHASTINAVPVVFCKDCKHCFVDGDNVRFNVCELNHNRVQADDWFCADGERKGGEE